MAIPSINDLITYVNTKITGLNWNANWNKVVLWFTDGTSDLTVNSVEVTTGFTGDVTGNVTGNASTVTNGVYTVGDQTIAGIKTFSSPIIATNNTDSSSSTTGSLKTAGGLGVAKKLYVGTDLNIGDNLTLGNKFTATASTATIASGAITYTGMNMIIDTEGAAASDDLTTINGMVAGDILILKIADAARNVVIKNSASLITSTAEDVTLDLISDCIIFHHNGTSISEIARGVKGVYGNSLAANGYLKIPRYPNDLTPVIMQWGTVTVGSSASAQTITYPISFPNSTLNVVTTIKSASGGVYDAVYFSVTSTTTSQVVFAATTSRYWQAIGY